MSEYATRTTTSPGSRSSSVQSANSERIFLSTSLRRNDLKGCIARPLLFGLDAGLLHDLRPARGFGREQLAELRAAEAQHLGALQLEALAGFRGIQRRRNGLLQTGEHGRRRAGGREYAPPVVGFR